MQTPTRGRRQPQELANKQDGLDGRAELRIVTSTAWQLGICDWRGEACGEVKVVGGEGFLRRYTLLLMASQTPQL